MHVLLVLVACGSEEAPEDPRAPVSEAPPRTERPHEPEPSPEPSPLQRLYETFVFSGHRWNGDGGVYHFNANVVRPETKPLRKTLYLVGTSVEDNRLVFQDFETFERPKYNACPRTFTARYTGPELDAVPLVSIENRRDLDDRFYRIEEVTEPLPESVRKHIGGATGFGFDFDEQTERFCRNEPAEKRFRFTRGGDTFEYYEADCSKWVEASSQGPTFTAFYRRGVDGAPAILCRGEECGGDFSSVSDVRFAADLDDDGAPELNLAFREQRAIFELGPPSTRITETYAWVEGEEWPCYSGREGTLLLENGDTNAAGECETTADCTFVLCPCSWTAVAKSDVARLAECAQMQTLARCARPGHRPELGCVGGSCTAE